MDSALPHLPLWAYVLVAVAFVLVIGRTLRGQDLRIDRLWIMPTLIILLTALALSQRPATELPVMAFQASAALGGAALGWWRGPFTLVRIDAQTEKLTSYSSPIGMIILLGVVAVRFVFRVWILEHAQAFNLTVGEVTDALLLFAVGLVCAERVELAIRATRALNAAKAEKVRSMFAPAQPTGKQRAGPTPVLPPQNPSRRRRGS